MTVLQVLAATTLGATAPVASGRCADFLAAMHRRPPHLDFVGCAYLPARQGKPLRATYRVAGRFAAATEAYLARAVGLPRLRHSCCQWDAPPHAFTDAAGRSYTVTMVSDDTPAPTRAAWPKIKAFEVTVETLSEDV